MSVGKLFATLSANPVQNSSFSNECLMVGNITVATLDSVVTGEEYALEE